MGSKGKGHKLHAAIGATVLHMRRQLMSLPEESTRAVCNILGVGNLRRLRDPITWIITYLTGLHRKTLRSLIKRNGNRRARALGASLPATSGNEDPDARLASSSCEPARLCDGSVEPASLPAAGGTDELEWEKPES